MSWRYRAIDGQGREVSALIEAASEFEARQSLRQAGLRVLALDEHHGRDVHDESSWSVLQPSYWMPPKRKDLVMVFRQLALMLRAGHTLYEALETTAQIANKRSIKRLFLHVADAIQRGQGFAQSVKTAGRPFTPLMGELIATGERSGELDLVLERIAADIERAGDLKRQLVAALMYPSIVVLMAVGVILFLVLSVVPRFAVFLSSRGKDVPWAAQTLMDITSWLMVHGPYLGGGIVLGVAALLLAYRIPAPRMRIDQLLLMTPIIGGSLTFAGMAQACWTLSLLLQSGLTLLDSLAVTANTLNNRAQRAAIHHASECVLSGQSLAQGLQSAVLPKLLRHMAAVGEKTGEVDQVMLSLGEYYRRELDARIKLMTSLIEPVLIVFVGGIVGFVYFAFFQAVMAVSSR